MCLYLWIFIKGFGCCYTQQLNQLERKNIFYRNRYLSINTFSGYPGTTIIWHRIDFRYLIHFISHLLQPLLMFFPWCIHIILLVITRYNSAHSLRHMFLNIKKTILLFYEESFYFILIKMKKIIFDIIFGLDMPKRIRSNNRLGVIT